MERTRMLKIKKAEMSKVAAHMEASIYIYTLETFCAWIVGACSVMSDFLWLHGRSLPAFSVHGISQARILEWVAISSSWDWLKDRGSENWQAPPSEDLRNDKAWEWSSGSHRSLGMTCEDCCVIFLNCTQLFLFLWWLLILYPLAYARICRALREPYSNLCTCTLSQSRKWHNWL